MLFKNKHELSKLNFTIPLKYILTKKEKGKGITITTIKKIINITTTTTTIKEGSGIFTNL